MEAPYAPGPAITIQVSDIYSQIGLNPVIKWIVKIAIVIVAIFAIVLAILGMISVSIECIFAGVINIVGGLLVILLEAPILFSFIRGFEAVSTLSSNRPPWLKMILFAICPTGAIILCQSVNIIFSSILLWLVAFVYFYFTFVRKRTQ